MVRRICAWAAHLNEGLGRACRQPGSSHLGPKAGRIRVAGSTRPGQATRSGHCLVPTPDGVPILADQLSQLEGGAHGEARWAADAGGDQDSPEWHSARGWIAAHLRGWRWWHPADWAFSPRCVSCLPASQGGWAIDVATIRCLSFHMAANRIFILRIQTICKQSKPIVGGHAVRLLATDRAESTPSQPNAFCWTGVGRACSANGWSGPSGSATWFSGSVARSAGSGLELCAGGTSHCGWLAGEQPVGHECHSSRSTLTLPAYGPGPESCFNACHSGASHRRSQPLETLGSMAAIGRSDWPQGAASACVRAANDRSMP